MDRMNADESEQNTAFICVYLRSSGAVKNELNPSSSAVKYGVNVFIYD
jgi:hypothetical protein